MKVALFVSMVCVGACSPQAPPTNETVVIEIPPPTPGAQTKMLAEATQVRKEAAARVLSKPASNDYLIQVISLTHKLDVAVAVYKLKPTPEHRARVKSAVSELEQLTK